MNEIREQILAEARSWIGTPWLHQHRMKSVGVDCAGLVTQVAAANGLSTFDVLNYERLPRGGELLEICNREMTRIATSAMRPADVACFRIRREPQHLGFVADHPLGGLSMIHGDSAIGRVVEHRLDARWLERIVAVYRLYGVPE